MKQRAIPHPVHAAESVAYESMPLSELLFRYLWPFWLFRDATRGDRFARAAAYRHNRRMRVHLPAYLLRWVVSCSLILTVTMGLESLSTPSTGLPDLFLVLAAAAGILFVGGICVLVVTAYLYLYLCRHDT